MKKKSYLYFSEIYGQNFNVDSERVILHNIAANNNEALLTNLSRAFDSLSHGLLISELHSYVLILTSVRLLSDYLSNRKQQRKVENVFSKWENIKTGVPKG